MRHFIRYYKWHLLFSLLVLVCIIFIYVSLTTQTSPDMTIGYAGNKYINIQTFNDNKAEIELLLHDANDDGKKTANFVTYTADLQKDIDEAFAVVKGLVDTTFLGEQHTVRINMISDYENSH